MGSELEESGEGTEEEEELEKEVEDLKKGDVEVPEGWKEWRSEKSARMGRFVDESEDSGTQNGYISKSTTFHHKFGA